MNSGRFGGREHCAHYTVMGRAAALCAAALSACSASPWVAPPALRMTLQAPDGDTQGPGLPTTLPLATIGRHVFSVASNTMAEDIYGPFRLQLRWLPAP